MYFVAGDVYPGASAAARVPVPDPSLSQVGCAWRLASNK